MGLASEGNSASSSGFCMDDHRTGGCDDPDGTNFRAREASLMYLACGYMHSREIRVGSCYRSPI